VAPPWSQVVDGSGLGVIVLLGLIDTVLHHLLETDGGGPFGVFGGALVLFVFVPLAAIDLLLWLLRRMREGLATYRPP
jgi:hypothetical protein